MVDVDEVLPESSTAVLPVEPEDPCLVYDDPSSCCHHGCRVLGPINGSALRCISEAWDCELHPGICVSPDVCISRPTSGNGGCDYGYSHDIVAACIPPDDQAAEQAGEG